MNIAVLCQSLCQSDYMNHSNRLNINASHHTMLHGKIEKHKIKKDICPIPHTSNHNKVQPIDDKIPNTSIKCDCSARHTVLFHYEMIFSDPSLDLTPSQKVISVIQPIKTIFSNNTTIPLERPPEIFV